MDNPTTFEDADNTRRGRGTPEKELAEVIRKIGLHFDLFIARTMDSPESDTGADHRRQAYSEAQNYLLRVANSIEAGDENWIEGRRR